MLVTRFIARSTLALIVAGPSAGCAARAPQASQAPAAAAAAPGPSEASMARPSSLQAPGQPAPSQAPAVPGAQQAAAPGAAPPARHAAASPAAGEGPAAAKGKEVASSRAKPGQADAEQMIIFEGRLEVQVESERFAETLHAVVDLAVERGGYIGKQDDRSVTVRVPSDSFREALREMEKLGTVAHRSVQAQDVSEAFHDIDVRLKNLLATRDRIEAFLERAKSIDEVLRVEQELARLHGEIDRLQGRKRFLAARAAYSTITVSLQPKPVPVVVEEARDEPPPPRPRTLKLPIDWFGDVSLESLLRLERNES